MEPRFGANFGQVRVHTDDKAAKLNRDLQAHAFTTGGNIYFGKDKFKPETQSGKELIAHELTHTIQQGAAIQRSADVEVRESSPPKVQRLGLSDALNYFADKANYIPGFRMFTVVLGVNPINMSRVERSAANVLRAIVEFIPGGVLVSDALANHGIFDKVGAWVEQQIAALGMTGNAIKQAVDQFLATLSWSDIFDLGGVWERAKRIFTEPIDRIIARARQMITGILRFIREAILLPLAKLAEGTRGYDLLKAVLGEDPVTGQPVPRDANTLIGGFMKLIGEEEIWKNIQKSNAVARCWAWFQGALNGLMGLVRQIPGKFVAAFQALEIIDLVIVPKAFIKLAGVFGGFALELITWAGKTIWTLLEIVFDVVSPGALGYIKRTGAALKSILKNPLPFVGNLVKAAKQGFLGFADNFGTHLKAGLIDWLTGSLPGIYIPKAFSLQEIVKFVLSVLGLSWANIRGKLVKEVGEPAVKAMEAGFDIVVTLVRDGPAAAWDKIKDYLGDLKDMVIGGITDFVIDMVVQKAVPKLIAMFIPGAGFVSAILSIYDTVMVFVNKISRIIQVVMAFIDSIIAIAAGQIGAAAARVEKILAGLLSLAINFLAGFIGLGKVADKVMAVINKVRAPIDKALDALIKWIVTMAKKLFAKVFGKDQQDERTDAQKQTDLNSALKDAATLQRKPGASVMSVREGLAKIKTQYRLTVLDVVAGSAAAGKQKLHVLGKINPEGKTEDADVQAGDEFVEVRTVKVDDAAAIKELQSTGLTFEAAAKQQLLTKPAPLGAGVAEVGGPVGSQIAGQFPKSVVLAVGTAGEKMTSEDKKEAAANRREAQGSVGERGDEHLLIFQKRVTSAKTGDYRVTDALLEAYRSKGQGRTQLSAVIAVEVTLVTGFAEATPSSGSATESHAVRKAAQLFDTVLLLKEKYGDKVRIEYHLITPELKDAAKLEKAKTFLNEIVKTAKMTNLKFIWHMVPK